MICVAIQNKTVAECLALTKGAELAELRIDLCGFDANEVAAVVTQSACPILATCRHDNMGLEKQELLLKAAVDAGAKYIDLEIEIPQQQRDKLVAYAKSKGCTVIISYHNYKETPDDAEMQKLISDCYAGGADVAKLAVQNNTKADAARTLSLYALGGRLVILGMGAEGIVTRVAAPLLGAEFTFASASPELATAPGQISKSVLQTIYSALD
jgi:3-dehydroquinate dehydratase type I